MYRSRSLSINIIIRSKRNISITKFITNSINTLSKRALLFINRNNNIRNRVRWSKKALLINITSKTQSSNTK